MIPDGLLQDRQGALTDLVLLERTQLSLVELRLGDMNVLTRQGYENASSHKKVRMDVPHVE